MIAFVLRLAAARGDLWFDEIWSFRLLDGVTHVASIFFALPYDNNHLLNTAWLFLVGPGAPALLVRLPAVVFGTLCVPVAARIGHRRHPLAGIAAAALVACDALLVQYGSEARGYSGLLLASLLAFDSLEASKREPERTACFVAMGAAVAFGTLSQLTMVATSLVICADAAIAVARRQPQGRRLCLRTALAVALGTLPAFVCLLASVLHARPHLGVQTPFSWTSFADGLARMAEATIGLGDKAGDPTLVCCVVGAVCVCALGLVPRERRALPALAILGVPALQAMLRLPNEQFARFHLVTSLGIILLAIELVARLASNGAPRYRCMALIVSLCLSVQVPDLLRLVTEGRGAFREPVALMAAEGPATFTMRPPGLAGETSAVVAWYAASLGADIAPERSTCPAHARWLILVREPGQSLVADDQRVEGPPGCGALYTPAHAYPAYGLSGFTWLLFRREGER